MAHVRQLTRVQKEAAAALKDHRMLSVTHGQRRGPHSFQRRVLQALVDAGIAEWSRSGFVYPVGTAEAWAYAEAGERQRRMGARLARIGELLASPEALAEAVVDLEFTLAGPLARYQERRPKR